MPSSPPLLTPDVVSNHWFRDFGKLFFISLDISIASSSAELQGHRDQVTLCNATVQ
jgi:hypothetical protein